VDLDLEDHTAHRSLEHDHIFGYAELLPQWTYEMFLDHILPEDRPEVDTKYRLAVDTLSDWNFECRIRRTDGEVRWIWAAGRHRTDQTGAMLRMSGIVQDITERKQALEALRLSEEKFAMAFANNPAAIALTRLEDGLFLDVNNTYVEMNGYSRDEVIGLSARKLNIWPTPEAAAKFVQELQEKGALNGWEQEILQKSGEAFIAQLSAMVLEIHGEKLILSTFIDISEKKGAEEALRANEKRLKRSQEVAHLGSWELDIRENKLTWSDEVYRIFGLKASGIWRHLRGIPGQNSSRRPQSGR